MKTETKNGTATNGNGKSLMPTRNDMPVKVRTQMIQLLNAQLADTFDLMSMAKQAHWNVRGPHFIGLHKLFDEVFEAVEGHVDLIAERCTALGGVAHGTVRMAAKSTRLEEYPGDIHARQYVANPGRSSFDTFITLERTDEPGVVYANGGATTVWLDFPAKKTVPMPQWLREVLE